MSERAERYSRRHDGAHDSEHFVHIVVVFGYVELTDCDAACQQPQRSSYPSQKCSFVRKTESVVRF